MKTHQLLKLDLNADTVESKFLPDCEKSIVACGTYQLLNSNGNEDQDQDIIQKQTRIGRLYIYSVENGNELTEILDIDSYGILDMKWNSSNFQIACACASGTVDIHSFDMDNNGVDSAQPAISISISSKDDPSAYPLCLSLDWADNSIVASSSDGNITLLETETQTVMNQWKAHDLEAWTCSFNRHNPQILYSGGDDCRWLQWDLRSNPASLPVFKSRPLMMGVTNIQNSPYNPNVLLVGGYDEIVRTFDTRMLNKQVADLNVGGGVWRLKFHPHNKDFVLAACMYGGFRMLKSADEWKYDIAHEYLEHSSIAYGIDWIKGCCNGEGEGEDLIASCSFYDNQLRLWSL